MPPERLAELRRQRNAVQAHLDWLDAEIAREAAPQSPEAPAGLPKLESIRDSAPAITAPAASVPEYEPDPVSAAADARKGCLIWGIALAGLGLALLIAIYFWRYREHPVLFAPPENSSRADNSPHAR